MLILSSGITATCVSKMKSSKRELRQLKKVTDIDTRRLKGIANKEMVDEILKVKKMTNELKKFKKGRGRGRKKSQEIKLCDMLGKELPKTLGTSQLNGSIIEKTILSAIDSSSPAIQSGKKKRGRKKKNGLTNSLTDLEEGEASRLTRTTRMHGILDECVSIAKEGCIWRITFCSEKKKNALTTEVS